MLDDGAFDTLRAGAELGGYRIDQRIGSGGMSVVYAATHIADGRTVALKLLASHLTDEQWTSRFVDEAKVLKNIDHPNVVRVLDFIELESRAAVAIVMERLIGPSLAAALRKRRLTVLQSLNVGVQLGQAISAVHTAGVIHRDIKPQNLVIVGNPAGDLSEIPAVKLLDFGIAKVPKAQSNVRTRTGHFLGTPAYMAPEQIVSHRIGPPADLYALAEIVVEMLTGRRLFRGDPIALLKTKVSKTPDVFLPNKVPYSFELTSCLQACLQPEPQKRPSLDVLIAALEKSRREADDDPDTDQHELVFEETQDGEVDTDPSPPDLTDAMFEQIQRDLGDVNELQPEAPPPRPAEDTPLELMRPEDREQFWPLPKEEPNAPDVVAPKERFEVKRPRRLAGSKGGAAAFATVEMVRRRPWLLPVSIAAGVVLLAAFGLFFSKSADDEEELPESTEPTVQASSLRALWEAKLEKRRALCARFVLPDPLPLKVLLDAARALHPRDHADAYRQADVLLCTALARYPADDEAVAVYVENQILAAGERLDPLERSELTDFTLLVQERAPQVKSGLLALARLALLRGDHAQAIGYLDRMGSSEDPGRELLVRAEALSRSDPKEALRILDSPELARWERRRRLRAELLASLGRYKSASDALEPQRADGDATALIALGELYARAGFRMRALEAYSQALDRNGSPGEATLRIAELILDYDEARAKEALHATIARADSPRAVRVRARLLLARAALRREELTEASSALDLAKADGASATELAGLRAELAHATGGANALIDLLRRSEPNPLLTAAAELEAGMYDDVLRRLDGPTEDPRVLALRAAAASSQKDSTLLRETLEALASTDPALFAEEETPPATARVLRAIRLPKGAEASGVVLGILLASAGAGAEREAALLLEPEATRSPLAALYAADLDMRLDRLRDAERIAREGLRRAPRSTMLKIALARILARRDRADAALKIWSKIPPAELAPGPALLDRLAAEPANEALLEAMPRLIRFSRARRVSYERGF